MPGFLLVKTPTREKKIFNIHHNEFCFWVISPKENKALWNDQSLQNVKFQFASILSPLGKYQGYCYNH